VASIADSIEAGEKIPPILIDENRKIEATK
jgi:hypothetical protein